AQQWRTRSFGKIVRCGRRTPYNWHALLQPKWSCSLPMTIGCHKRPSKESISLCRSKERLYRFLTAHVFGPSACSLQFISQHTAFDEVHALFVIMARDDEEVLFGRVETIEPGQFRHDRFFVFLNPGRVLSLYVTHPVHVPRGVASEQVFTAGGEHDINHLRPRSMSGRFDEHDAGAEGQIPVVVDDVVAAGHFRCELDFRHLGARQQRLHLVAGEDRLWSELAGGRRVDDTRDVVTMLMSDENGARAA